MSIPSSELDRDPFTIRFSATAEQEGRALLSLVPSALFRRFVNDKESEAVRWAAAALIDVVLAGNHLQPDQTSIDAGPGQEWDALVTATADRQTTIRELLNPFAGQSSAAKREALLERAPIRALSGVWLEGVSQPATQPDGLVNRLFQTRYREQTGDFEQPPQWMRHQKVLLAAGIALPGIDHPGFDVACKADTDTWLLASFYLALAMYGASRLPEIIAVNWAYNALGIDQLLGGDNDGAPKTMEEARAIAVNLLDDSSGTTVGIEARQRFFRAARICIELETLQVDAISRRIRRMDQQTLDEKMAQIVQRHAPYAAGHHGAIKVGGALLAEQFSAPDFDARAFVRAFKTSPYVRPREQNAPCRFLSSIRFGGPMFGIFDASEASVMREWCEHSVASADAVALTELPASVRPWDEILTAAQFHAGFHLLEAQPDEGFTDRELFFMLVNVEAYPGVLPFAREIVKKALASASRLMHAPGDGTEFRYTDSRFFPYSPQDLESRLAAVYRDKLLAPIAPLQEIPSADDVVFVQTTFALGNLIDGAWAYRIGLRGRHLRPVDAALFQIYADEMGQGIVAKNHIQLILQVLESMGVKLPHIATRDFIDQEELLDELYPFALFQLSLAQFPDTFHAEIVGFNLGIEMFGLGELRLHEIQKMRHWGFDASYEVTHLSIDNFGSGHARTSITAIQTHLDRIRQELGSDACESEWRRIWTGYASFAQFIERSAMPSEVELPDVATT